MKWSRQLRWKLFVSHAAIIVIAVAVLLATAQVLVRSSIADRSPLTVMLETTPGPVVVTGAAEGAVQERFETILEQALLVAGFGALVVAVVVSLFVSRRIVEPLQNLSDVSRRLAQGSYRERTEIRSDDELAELSQSINQLAEALDQTERRRLALLADVAHELRTPLTTIEGYMEGLLDGVVAPDEQTFTLVLHEAARLRRLTEELGLLSRAEAGELANRPRQSQLAGLLHGLVARYQQQFDACEVELRLVQPDDSPAVYADPDRIAQVVINLLQNALRYTPAGGRVVVSLAAFEEYSRITVQDSGIGVAPEHLPLIFERFYRVDKSRARASGGTGIGLTIARHLVYANGGEIWAESAGLGSGTAFHLTLPLFRVQEPVQIVVEP